MTDEIPTPTEPEPMLDAAVVLVSALASLTVGQRNRLLHAFAHEFAPDNASPDSDGPELALGALCAFFEATPAHGAPETRSPSLSRASLTAAARELQSLRDGIEQIAVVDSTGQPLSVFDTMDIMFGRRAPDAPTPTATDTTANPSDSLQQK